jgi:hypothetical protein
VTSALSCGKVNPTDINCQGLRASASLGRRGALCRIMKAP